MKAKHIFIILLTLVLALGTSPASIQAQRLELTQGFAERSPLGTTFTYQGYLTYGGSPAEGAYDFEFSLYDALTAGTQVGTTLFVDDVTVSQGLFSVALDFGTVFDGTALYLAIGVRAGSSSGAYTALSPRQALTAAPYALYTAKAAIADALGGPAPTVFTTTPLDFAGNVGVHTSITIGADGLGLISYRDNTNSALKVAHCDDTACTSATTYTLDNTGNVGEYTSIAVGTDELGLISYFDGTNGYLKVAHCNNTACTSATIYTLDSAGDVGEYTSIAIGADGLGLISYKGMNDLKVAHCNDIACSSGDTYTLDSPPGSVFYTSIAIGTDELGLISYYDNTYGWGMKVAHCEDTACTSATITILDGGPFIVGEYTSLAVGTDGLGLISYYDDDNSALKVAHCNNKACTSATTYTLDSAGDVGEYTSISIGADDLGLISYYDSTNDALKIAHCEDTACSSASTHILDDSANVGLDTDIITGADGLGLISYYDSTNGDLVVAHCDDTLCKP